MARRDGGGVGAPHRRVRRSAGPAASPALAGRASLALALAAREHGGAGAPTWAPLQRARLASLALAPAPELATDAGGARGEVLWLDLDAVEQRYLLAAAGDGAIEVYDVQAANAGTGHAPAALGPVGSARQRSRPESAHRFAATCVAWYPVDSGMFVSGSADKSVRLWDANALEAVCVFPCAERVLCCGMSLIARAHCLVAVGSEGRGVQLADPASGAFTHVLSGHRDSITALAWSLTDEHQLLSGDAAGEVRVWDVRRPGARAMLDLGATPGARAAAGRKRAAPAAGGAGGRAPVHDGGVTSIMATPDGLHLVTGGRDGRLRLWDAARRTHLLVHYGAADAAAAPGAGGGAARRPLRLAATEDGRWLFQPCGSMVQVFNVATGALLAQLRQGHFEPVTACVWSALTQQLYTAGSDGAVLAWAPRVAVPVEEDELLSWRARGGGCGALPDWAVVDEDAWSDDY